MRTCVESRAGQKGRVTDPGLYQWHGEAKRFLQAPSFTLQSPQNAVSHGTQKGHLNPDRAGPEVMDKLPPPPANADLHSPFENAPQSKKLSASFYTSFWFLTLQTVKFFPRQIPASSLPREGSVGSWGSSHGNHGGCRGIYTFRCRFTFCADHLSAAALLPLSYHPVPTGASSSASQQPCLLEQTPPRSQSCEWSCYTHDQETSLKEVPESTKTLCHPTALTQKTN